MRGKHQVIVENMRVRYKFVVERNLTVLRGDSATGKTTMIDMVASYQRLGEQSGVSLRADKPCVVLTSQQNWKASLSLIHESIVFIDEGEMFVHGLEFAEAIRHSDNYFVIATRQPLFYLPYSTKEIYGIKDIFGI